MENVEGDMKSVALCDFDSAHSHFATFCCKIWFHCAQIELNSWSVTCPPSKSPPPPEIFPAATTLSIAPSRFFGRAVSFCSGIFLLVAFWTEADIFNAPLLFFECGKLFAPAILLVYSPLPPLSHFSGWKQTKRGTDQSVVLFAGATFSPSFTLSASVSFALTVRAYGEILIIWCLTENIRSKFVEEGIVCRKTFSYLF